MANELTGRRTNKIERVAHTQETPHRDTQRARVRENQNEVYKNQGIIVDEIPICNCSCVFSVNNFFRRVICVCVYILLLYFSTCLAARHCLGSRMTALYTTTLNMYSCSSILRDYSNSCISIRLRFM